MKTPQSLLPDLPTLTARLTAALDGPDRPVEVIGRKMRAMVDTFPNEVVTCLLPNGHISQVFVKYEGEHSHVSYGHRGNLAYEAEVYRRVLGAMPDFRPRCLGAHTDEKTGQTWLMLEYVDHSIRIHDLRWKYETRIPAAVVQTARWIGQFHAFCEGRVASRALAFLTRYDEGYFKGWARRASEFTRPLRRRFPWLKEVCEQCHQWSAPLLAAPKTVIHGELYMKQILVRRSRLFIVDWESAAIGAGEIDLATLTEGEGWAPELVRRCEREYERARWGGRAPSDFRRTLDAARIYLHFRWLGERPEWTLQEKSFWRYRHLRRAAKRLGLL